MCGRFTQRTAAAAVARLFAVDNVPDLQPRYNIAPTQLIAAFRVRCRPFDEISAGAASFWSMGNLTKPSIRGNPVQWERDSQFILTPLARFVHRADREIKLGQRQA